MKNIALLITFLFALSIISCDKDESSSSSGGSGGGGGSASFNKAIEIDNAFSDQPRGIGFKDDKLIITGETDIITALNAFLVVVNSQGNATVTKKFANIPGFEDPDFLTDGGFICKGISNNSFFADNIYIFNSEGTITVTYEVGDIVESPLGLSSSSLSGLFVNDLGEIVIYGYGTDGNGDSRIFIVKMNSDATIHDQALYEGSLWSLGEIANNEIAMLSSVGASKYIQIIDENLDVSNSRIVSSLSTSNFATIVSRSDQDEFYYGRNKLDTEGNILITNGSGGGSEGAELSVTDDGGLLVGGAWTTPANESAYFLEKLTGTDGSSEWEVKELEVPPYGVQAAYELNNGSILGVSFLWGGATKDVSVFKVNSQGEF